MKMNTCSICCPVAQMATADNLDNLILNMKRIGGLFSDYKIILFLESATEELMERILKNMQENEKIDLLINSKFRTKREITHNLANARNKLLNRVKQLGHEYFLMMDWELCAVSMSLDVLKRHLGRRDWDALTFNVNDANHNLWALSLNDLVFSMRHFSRPDVEKVYDEKLKTKLENCKEGGLVRVLSAFNGLAIYRTSVFIESSYDGLPRKDLIPPFMLEKNKKITGNDGEYALKLEDEEEQDCEHRAFHLHAIVENNARIRMSPECLF